MTLDRGGQEMGRQEASGMGPGWSGGLGHQGRVRARTWEESLGPKKDWQVP